METRRNLVFFHSPLLADTSSSNLASPTQPVGKKRFPVKETHFFLFQRKKFEDPRFGFQVTY